jgi:starch synthase (maltosyl-transferring)
MRIALTITELFPGGAEKCLVNLACFLHAQGHEVRVWELGSPPPEHQSQLIRMLEQARIPVESLQGNRFWHLPRVVRRLRSQLEDFAPDVVQSFLFHANFATALAVRNRPYHFFGGARVRQPECIRQRIQRWTATKMVKLICVSQSVAEHCQQVERIPQEKLVVIPNGIGSDTFDRTQSSQVCWTQFGMPERARVILFVGRLTAQKGIETLVRRADEWLLDLPEHYFVVLGGGELSSKLHTLVRGLRCGPRIKLIGWHANALAWMQAAEMLVLPAQYEGMPNVILEAMSVRLPVITFDVEGVDEVLHHSNYPSNDPSADIARQVVPRGDFSALERAIAHMAQDGALRERCGEFNQAHIKQHFSLHSQMEKYLREYS